MTKYVVTEGSRVKVATEEEPKGQVLNEGDVFEATEEDVQNLVDSGAVVEDGKAPKKKSDKQVKSGKDVETPEKEGKKKEDGETAEVK